MYPQSLWIALAAAVGTVTAIIVPEDAPDGILAFGLGKEGKAEKRDGPSYIVLEEFNATDFALAHPIAAGKRSARLSPREGWLPVRNVHCGNDKYVDPGDYKIAVNLLSNRCDSKGQAMWHRSAIIAKVGSAITFVCNWGDGNSCGSQEVVDSMWVISSEKGCNSQTRTGWVDLKDWAKTVGRDSIGEDICPGAKQI